MSVNKIDVVILISANTEWQEIKNLYPYEEIFNSPYGEWFYKEFELNKTSIFFQSGWGKILAGASTQYAIDKWNPTLIANLGTCGGFQGCTEVGTIILVDKTIVYDIKEQMGDQEEAIDYFSTEIDLSWLKKGYPGKVKKYKMLSADRDIETNEIPMLKKKYNGIAADWESGSIALIAKRNNVNCLILRGVSDIVGDVGGEAYEGRIDLFRERARNIMKILLQSFSDFVSSDEFNAT